MAARMATSLLAVGNSKAAAESLTSFYDATETAWTLGHRDGPATAALGLVLLPGEASGGSRLPIEFRGPPLQPIPTHTPFADGADGPAWCLIRPMNRGEESWRNPAFHNRLQTSRRTWPVCWDPPANGSERGTCESGPGLGRGQTAIRPVTVESTNDRGAVGVGRVGDDEFLGWHGAGPWLGTSAAADAASPLSDVPSRRFRFSAGTAPGGNPERIEWFGRWLSGVGPKLAFTARSGLWRMTLGYGYELDLTRDEHDPGHSIWLLYQYNFRREKAIDTRLVW